VRQGAHEAVLPVRRNDRLALDAVRWRLPSLTAALGARLALERGEGLIWTQCSLPSPTWLGPAWLRSGPLVKIIAIVAPLMIALA